jgi:hypothetical protein
MDTVLCQHLTAIRDEEIGRGNEIDSVVEREFENVDLLVMLKKPFGAYYEDFSDPRAVSADVNTDPHYPVGKSYYCREHRQAIFAPQEMRR